MTNKTQSLKKNCVSCWTAYILKDDSRSLQYQIFSGNYRMNTAIDSNVIFYTLQKPPRLISSPCDKTC